MVLSDMITVYSKPGTHHMAQVEDLLLLIQPGRIQSSPAYPERDDSSTPESENVLSFLSAPAPAP